MEPESEGPKDLLDDREQLIRLIQGLLKDILQQTQSLPKGTSKFHCKDPPAISIGDYLRRISKYAHCSNSVYVVALIYIDRFQERAQEFVINRFCMHRLLICSIMLAAKYMDDFYYKNDYYAKVGGISKADINILQIEFLMNVDFTMHITARQFETYLQKLYGFKEVNPKNQPIKTPSISQ